jgi:hypothetical protein
MNTLNVYTFDEFLNNKNLPNDLIKITLSEDTRPFDFPSEFTRTEGKIIFFIQVNKQTSQFIVYDKNSDENEPIATEILKLYSEKHPEFIKKAAPAIAVNPNAQRKEELSKAESIKRTAIEKAQNELRKIQEIFEEEKRKFEEKKERSKSQIILCDKEILLINFLRLSLEELEEGKIICIEDIPEKFNLIPEENQQEFILLKGKLYFFSSVKLERDYLNKISGVKMAVLNKNANVNKELSKKLTQMYIGFQRRMAEMKEKGVSIKEVSETPFKKKAFVQVPAFEEKEGDTKEITNAKRELYDIQIKLLQLESNPYDIDLQINIKSGYSSLHTLDENIFENINTNKLTPLRIIPMEYIENYNGYFIIKDEIVEYAKEIFARRNTLKDYDPTYVIKDDFDTQMILMENIRRHFFEPDMVSLKEKYVKGKNATAAVKYLALLEENKEKSMAEFKEFILKSFNETTRKEEKTLYRIIYDNFDTWARNREIVNEIADHSQLSADELEIIEHDAERISEEDDMSKPTSAYPPSEEGMNAITLDDVTLYQLHYHTDKTSETYNVEKISEQTILSYLREELRIQPTYTNRCSRKDICKRNYTLYQNWRALRKNFKEDFRKILQEKLYDILLIPFTDRQKLIFQQIKDDLTRSIGIKKESVKVAEKNKEIANEYEKKILNEVTRIFNERDMVYNRYIRKERALKDLLATDINYHIGGLPNTSIVFCPYCAKFLADRTGTVACKYLYNVAYKDAHKHELDSTGKTPIGKFNSAGESVVGTVYRTTNPSIKVSTPDVCAVCNGPVCNHDHYYLDTGIAPATNVNLCMGYTDRRKGELLDTSCIAEGGGGIVEAAARSLAYRDYIKEKLVNNSPDNNFGIQFPEMAIKADNYARIIRSRLAIPPARITGRLQDPTYIFERANYAIDTGHWPLEGEIRAGRYVVTSHYAKPEDILSIPAVKEPTRLEIENEVRRQYTPPKKGSTVPPPKKESPQNNNSVAIQSQLEEYIIQKSALEEELRKIKGNPKTTMWEDAQQIEDINKTLQEIDREIASLQARLPTQSARGGSFRRRTLKRKTRMLTN